MKDECTMCGKTGVELTVIDDVDRVCEDCLENEYFYCSDCHEYWQYLDKDYRTLKNGNLVCEDCAEEHNEDEFDEIF